LHGWRKREVGGEREHLDLRVLPCWAGIAIGKTSTLAGLPFTNSTETETGSFAVISGAGDSGSVTGNPAAVCTDTEKTGVGHEISAWTGSLMSPFE
jgi:hypothetical protein